MTSKAPEKPKRRLENIRPWEVSIVDEGANGEVFFLLKGRDAMASDGTVELAQQDTDGRVFTTVRKNESVEQAAPKDDEEGCKSEDAAPKEAAGSSAALVSAAEKLMALAKLVREKSDGWPGNFGSVVESVVTLLKGAMGTDKYPSPKSAEEPSEKASPAGVASALNAMGEKLLSYGKAMEEGTVPNLSEALGGMVRELSSMLAEGEKYPSPTSKEEPAPAAEEKEAPAEKSDESAEKRGRKISGARLMRLEKMESQLASLHEQLKGLMAEVVEEEKVAPDGPVAKQAPQENPEVLALVEKRLAKLEEMVEKISLRRAEPKGTDVVTTSKVEKRDESSFAAVLGLKF